MEIGPGVKAQGLYRDDFLWQQTHTVPRGKYSGGSDVRMGLLVPGVKAGFFRTGSRLLLSSAISTSPLTGMIGKSAFAVDYR